MIPGRASVPHNVSAGVSVLHSKLTVLPWFGLGHCHAGHHRPRNFLHGIDRPKAGCTGTDVRLVKLCMSKVSLVAGYHRYALDWYLITDSVSPHLPPVLCIFIIKVWSFNHMCA